MDKIDEALALPTFGEQYKAIRALVQAADDNWEAVASDPRITAWQQLNGEAIFEIMMMSLEAAVNDTVVAQISTPITSKGNKLQ